MDRGAWWKWFSLFRYLLGICFTLGSRKATAESNRGFGALLVYRRLVATHTPFPVWACAPPAPRTHPFWTSDLGQCTAGLRAQVPHLFKQGLLTSALGLSPGCDEITYGKECWGAGRWLLRKVNIYFVPSAAFLASSQAPFCFFIWTLNGLHPLKWHLLEM